MNYGMDFNKSIVPNGFINKDASQFESSEYLIPGYTGYYYSFKDRCVYSYKKGRDKYYPKRMKLKIYLEKDKTKDKFYEFVNLMDDSNYRHKIRLNDVEILIRDFYNILNKYEIESKKIIKPGLHYL